MTILGTQHKQHRDHITDDTGDYISKSYTVTVRIYPEEADKGAVVARKKFEGDLLNRVIHAGDGRVRVDTVVEV